MIQLAWPALICSSSPFLELQQLPTQHATAKVTDGWGTLCSGGYHTSVDHTRWWIPGHLAAGKCNGMGWDDEFL